MIKTIILDGIKSYFYDSKSNDRILKYNPLNENLALHITLDDSELEVSRDKINRVYGGNIIVQHNEDMLFIDDGYRNKLIKAGYIVYKDFDNRKCKSYEGSIIKSNVYRDIQIILSEVIRNTDVDTTFYIDPDNYQIEVNITGDNGYDYIIRINDINTIVNKNLGRKDNSLTYYPFSKNMDKFGTMYISVFAERKETEESDKNPSSKFQLPDTIIKDLILNLGPDYHFSSLPIKGNIIFTPEL